MIDLAIKITNTIVNSSFGISIESGDLLTDTGLKGAVVFSLFTDRRAEDGDALPDETGTDRGGYWADTYADDKLDSKGSRLWLLRRANDSDETLRRAEFYAKESLAWMINRNIALSITVSAIWVSRGVMGLKIDMPLVDGSRYSADFEYLVS